MLVVYEVRVLYKTCIKMYNLNVFPLVIAMPMEISMLDFNIYLGRAEIYIFFQNLQVQVLDLWKVTIAYLFTIYFISRCDRFFNHSVVRTFKIDTNTQIQNRVKHTCMYFVVIHG